MYTRILVPVDGSATSERGLGEAIALAKVLGARLLLLNVVEDFPVMVEVASVASFDDTRAALLKVGRGILDRAAARATQAGVAHESVLHERATLRPADAIVEEAGRQRCDLIVMGTHGRRGFSRMTLGSDSELVLRQSPVPVLLVRQSD